MADVFHGLVFRRPYHAAFPPPAARQIIENGADKQFNPLAAATFAGKRAIYQPTRPNSERQVEIESSLKPAIFAIFIAICPPGSGELSQQEWRQDHYCIRATFAILPSVTVVVTLCL